MDGRVCNFEMDQWLSACKIEYRSEEADLVIIWAEQVLEAMISSDIDQVLRSTQCTDV